ncbi:MAG: hypothetical protein P4L40_02180 [Terracidiphilus sp.]|nr:hypothetical protein [Terracidiphilus sp.]
MCACILRVCVRVYCLVLSCIGQRVCVYFMRVYVMGCARLAGGPGCSSLLGFFMENGPLIPLANGSLTLNPFAWNTFANTLYSESPPVMWLSSRVSICACNPACKDVCVCLLACVYVCVVCVVLRPHSPLPHS